MPHHHHHKDHVAKNLTFSFIAALSLNLLFVIVESTYALIVNSASLLADAGHNFGDVLGLSIACLANYLLKKEATMKYSYGFKRTTILAALVNAILLVIAVGIIFYESAYQLFSNTIVHEKLIIIVAAIGILVNGGTALLFIKAQHDLNAKAAFLHLAYDALISLGVVVTGILILLTKQYWFDPLAGIAIALFILWGTWRLLRDAIDLILDAVPREVNRDHVEQFLRNLPEVENIHHLHIWSLSTQEIALTVHVLAPQGLSDATLQAIHQKLAIRFHIGHATIQVEGTSRCVGARSLTP